MYQTEMSSLFTLDIFSFDQSVHGQELMIINDTCKDPRLF